MEFMREFPDDDACLEWLWRTRYSRDGNARPLPEVRQAAGLQEVRDGPAAPVVDLHGCGHHLHPTAGTIFHKSSTSLHLWFYAMYLVTSSKTGVSAKHLERELGVTYKTAWRMFNLIRNSLMVQDDEPLSGEVEVDETAMGGKPRATLGRDAAPGGTDLWSGGRWKQHEDHRVRHGRARRARPGRGR